MSNRFKDINTVYEKALERARCNCLQEAFEGYVQTFLDRIKSSIAANREFRAFYRYQLATYLEEKNNFILGIIEGDMITDLIEETYEEFEEQVANSQIKISSDGRFNLLEQIRIVFPGQSDTCCPEEKIRVSK